MVASKVPNAVIPGRAAGEAGKEARKEPHDTEDKKLDKALKDTFPSSDPPAATQPGSGITGPEVEPTSRSPSQRGAVEGLHEQGRQRRCRPVFARRLGGRETRDWRRSRGESGSERHQRMVI